MTHGAFLQNDMGRSVGAGLKPAPTILKSFNPPNPGSDNSLPGMPIAVVEKGVFILFGEFDAAL